MYQVPVVFIYTYAVSGMMQVFKLHNIKQTNVISLASFVSVTFKGSFRIVYVFASPIIPSICTLLLEIARSFKTVLPVILFVFRKKSWNIHCYIIWCK